MKDYLVWKDIINGVISNSIVSIICIIASSMLLVIKSIPIWVWVVLAVCILFIVHITIAIKRRIRIIKIINSFKEANFGDSRRYTWDYRKSTGKYSAYGYEPYKIEVNNCSNYFHNEVIDVGYSMREECIKLIIQLTIIRNVEKNGHALDSTITFLINNGKSFN